MAGKNAAPDLKPIDFSRPLPERIEGPFYHSPEPDGTPGTCNGCASGWPHAYSFPHAHLTPARPGRPPRYRICRCEA